MVLQIPLIEQSVNVLKLNIYFENYFPRRKSAAKHNDVQTKNDEKQTFRKKFANLIKKKNNRLKCNFQFLEYNGK